jgi:uncharacterized protein GlcG (DUF336 family)
MLRGRSVSSADVLNFSSTAVTDANPSKEFSKEEGNMGKLKILMLGATAALGSVGMAFADEMAAPVSASGLTAVDAKNIFSACKKTANGTPSPIRGTPGTKMWCAVLDREGQTLLIQATDTGESPGPHLTTDAWRASIEIAEAKAYTALSVSSNDAALDSRTVGLLARQDGPGSTASADIGTDKGVASLFGVGNTNPFRSLIGNPSLSPDDKTGSNHHGIVTFAGGQPVYNCKTHKLLGGVGVSGDAVDEDDTVAKGAVTGAGFCLANK